MMPVNLTQAECMIARLGKTPVDVYVIPDVRGGRWSLSSKPKAGARLCGVYTQAVAPADLLADAREASGE